LAMRARTSPAMRLLFSIAATETVVSVLISNPPTPPSLAPRCAQEWPNNPLSIERS
jgi:hypothetical protein